MSPPPGVRFGERTMKHSILWRRLDLPGHDFARVVLRENRWELSGTAVFAHGQSPCRLDYFVACDTGWRTRSARVCGVVGDREVDLTISVDAEQRWYMNGTESTTVAGCVDIDLGFTPATNLLPIRRLSLGIGKEAEVAASWLPFPSLELELLPQVYRHEGEWTYRYESGGGTFVRVLEVNAVGLVTRYPGLWQAETTP